MVSISQDNLFGTGRKLKVQATLGGKLDEYVLSFTEPWLFDRRITAGFDLFLRTDDDIRPLTGGDAGLPCVADTRFGKLKRCD